MILTQNTYSTTHPFFVQGNNTDNLDSDSIASSPHSTLSQYSNNFHTSTPLSATFDVPRRPNININNNNNNTSTFKFPASSPYDPSQSLSQVPDLMPSSSESWWLLQSQQQQTPRTTLRMGHNRESSLSSLNSNGPASPYNANMSNPQIAINDSGDAFHDLSGDGNYSYQSTKPMMSDNFYATLQSLTNQGNGAPDMQFADGLPSLSAPQPRRFERGLLPAADVSSIGSATRSHPASVASSTIGGDSPATPSFQEPAEDENRRRKNGEMPEPPTALQHFLEFPPDEDDFSCLHFDAATFSNGNVPKLDRTMTDVYSDELYSPHFTITSASPQPQNQMAMSPSNTMFAERLALANSAHLSAAQSPVSGSSRNNSPFRHGSPLAPALNDFSQQTPQIRLNSAQQVREKQKLERDAKALQQQLARNNQQQQQQSQQQGTPSTISPKDAMLEFNEADDASNFPLFPPQETATFGMNQMSKAMPQQQQQQHHQPAAQNFQTTRTPLQTAFDFSMPTGIQMPQQYPFVARPRQQQVTPSVSTFSRMSSAETNGSTGSDVSVQRPARTNADGGTYTCTYHGCTQRFETPQLLQKHKREGHRQANTLTTARTPVTPNPAMPETLLGSQAGPHRCDRINPSTGKPCNTVFSRPYDLTRHEDTIHNARKKKVRCNMCTEEKTFSRADALTRHYRVCHPDVEFPGKHRRRGGS
ncbi:uncharacterized protein JN550_012524 [Neoarthrinium moseri]|uniref:uncharacterized protein n=1 Tax=Neoarthrinium moseri TaxID=1658444 RepID=UPI001FDCF174|nr:uncharacterized protein JN550_012524 [Neoarthrinium moseri]KAI1858692.1 hypothetical protein JN550_012524 [Neoarthrinium moseri]